MEAMKINKYKYENITQRSSSMNFHTVTEMETHQFTGSGGNFV